MLARVVADRPAAVGAVCGALDRHLPQQLERSARSAVEVLDRLATLVRAVRPESVQPSRSRGCRHGPRGWSVRWGRNETPLRSVPTHSSQAVTSQRSVTRGRRAMDVRMVGPYRIDRMLGRGGMGEVYRAYDTRKRDRVVALKVLADHLTADADFRARFQREAEIVAMLREPHIIPIHDYGEIDGRLYLDMRLVDGDDLAARLLNGPLMPERAVAIVEQVAAALDAAAAEGLLHRDVKPSNVLVTRGPPEFAYLTDFGIARFAAAGVRTALTSSGTVLGTVEYMAPERFGTDAVDHRADIYSLACVLFECLTGQRPFPERTIPALIGAHVARMPPRVGQLKPGLPPAIDDVVARGLAKQPKDRQHSAGEFAADARCALSSVSDSSVIRSTRDLPTVGTTLPAQRGDAAHGGRKPSPPRRRRVQPWVIALATVVTIVVVGLAIRNVPTRDGGETPAQPSATGSELAGSSATGPEMALLGNEDAVSSVAVTELDGDVVVVSGGFDDSVRAWDLDTGRSIGGPLLGHDADVLSVACADVGGRPVVVSGSFDTTLRLWDLASQQPAGGPLPAADMVSAVAVAQVDGRPVAFTGSWDDVIRAWDLETDQRRGEPFNGHAGEVVALATTSLDGRPVVVSGSFDDTVRVWDAATGQQLGQPLIIGLSGDVFAVTAEQVDGRPVAAAAGKDHAIAVWDLRSRQLLFRLAGHTEDVKALTTSVVGQPLLIYSGTDGTIRFWSLATGQPVGPPLVGHDARPVYGLAVSGELLISAGGDRAVRVWDLPQRAGLR
ncbi:MAG: WD40 repeat domain-containing serine/threonine protein kinase [Pseudonocardia sp.]